MEDIILNVLLKYGIKPEKWILIKEDSERCIWKVEAEQGDFALKLVREEKARASSSVSKYLTDKGVPVITILPALNGERVVQYNKSFFILYRWFDGEAITYDDNKGTIERMCTLLAQFHEASRGYIAIGQPIRDKTHLLKEYTARFKMLQELYKRVQDKDDEMAKEFKRHYPWLYKRCLWVIKHIQQSTYQKLVDTEKLDPVIGHGDYARPNILSDDRGNWKIIDLDTVGKALRVRDLSRLIMFVNEDLGGWDMSRFHSMLQAYGKIRPLSKKEIAVIILDQYYPYQAIDLVRRHYLEGTMNFTKLFKLCLETDKSKIYHLGNRELLWNGKY